MTRRRSPSLSTLAKRSARKALTGSSASFKTQAKRNMRRALTGSSLTFKTQAKRSLLKSLTGSPTKSGTGADGCGCSYGSVAIAGGIALILALVFGSCGSDNGTVPSPTNTRPATKQAATSMPRPTSTLRVSVTPTSSSSQGSVLVATLDPTAVAEFKTPTPKQTIVLDLQYVADVTVPDGTVLDPGESFVKSWRLLNAGQNDWPDGLKLKCHDGTHMETRAFVELESWEAGAVKAVEVPMNAPKTPGAYKSYWQVCDGDSCSKGSVYVLIEVRDPNAVPTAKPIPTLEPQPAQPAPVIRSCCKYCNCPSTKPCGDSCISASKTCNKGPGCACCK